MTKSLGNNVLGIRTYCYFLGLALGSELFSGGFFVSQSSYALAAASKKSAHRRITHPTSQATSANVQPVDEASMNPLDHNNKGVEYGRRGLWPQAISEHEIALNGDPENSQFKTNLSAALLKYGQVLSSQKKWSLAISKLREALYVDPNNADAANLLDSCIKSTGKDPNAHMKMGDELEISGNYVEAIAEYRRGVRADESGPAYAALGRALMKQGTSSPSRLVEGFSQMKLAVAKSWEPSQQNELATAHCQLANTLKEYALTAKEGGRQETALKRLQNASVEYRRAVQLNPLNSDAVSGLIEVAREAVAIRPSFDNHLMLGGAYLLRGDMDRAKHEYEECNKLEPMSDSLNNARKAFHFAVVSSTQHLDMIPRSIQVAEDNLKKNPNDPVWLYIWGMGKENQGDRESAKKAYTKAYSINPALPKLKDRLGLVIAPGKQATSSSGAANSSQDSSSSVNSGNSGSSSPALSQPPVSAKEIESLAQAQGKFRSGDLDGGLKDCQEILEKNMHNGEAWLLQGRIQEKKGLLDDASASYRQAAYLKVDGADDASRQVDSSRIAAPLSEAEKQIASADYVGASATLKEIVSLAPNLPMPHRKLADILEKLGDTKEAERERRKASDLDKK
jgi:tetratricopeptide (TPR) repeat protein